MTCPRSKKNEKRHGWTILHRAAYTYDVDNLQKVIKTLGMTAPVLAKKYTYDTGELPIHLMNRNPYFFKNEKHFCQLLEPITFNYKIRPLSEQLDKKEIKSNYPELKISDPLYVNLVNAYNIINKIRLIVKTSDTHPENNSLSDQDKLNASVRIQKMRNECDRKISFIKTQTLKNIVDCVIKYKAGNCFELAHFAYYELRKIDKTINAEIYELKKGDHVFLVIGRDPSSKPADFKTWGTSAIVCDPWGGYAIPAAEIPKKLTCYLDYNGTRVIVPFDPHYHQLNIKFSIQNNKCIKKRKQQFQDAIDVDVLKKIVEEYDRNRSSYKLFSHTPETLDRLKKLYADPTIKSVARGKVQSCLDDPHHLFNHPQRRIGLTNRERLICALADAFKKQLNDEEKMTVKKRN